MRRSFYRRLSAIPRHPTPCLTGQFNPLFFRCNENTRVVIRFCSVSCSASSMNTALESLGPSTNENNEQLSEFEFFWRDHCIWLKERGYLLRQRYRPGWVASWIGTNKRAIGCEDFLVEPLVGIALYSTPIISKLPSVSVQYGCYSHLGQQACNAQTARSSLCLG